MEQIKITNFNRENPARQFPAFSKVSGDHCARIRKQLARRLGLDETCDKLELTRTIASREKMVETLSESQDPTILPVLKKLGLPTPEHIYINWYRFDDIDRMKFSDFEANLKFIWYPGPDDLDIFDDSLNWIASITHEGMIGALVFRDHETLART